MVPAYSRPEAAIPDDWATPTVDVSPVDTVISEDWWQSFGDEDLSAFINRGLKGNFNLAAAVSRVEEAQGQAEISGAPLYPSLDANAQVTRGTLGKSPRTQQAGFVASYELDFWGKNRAAASVADELAKASVFDRDTVALTLTADIANAYFQVISLRERVRFANAIVNDAQRVLSLVILQAESGIASDLEVAQQRNVLAVFRANLPALQQQMEQVEHALATLVGANPGDIVVRAPDLSAIKLPVVKAGLPSELLERRPDIRGAEARLVSSNFNIGVARAAFYPSLSLTASEGVTNTSLSNFFPVNEFFSVGTALIQPLFHGGALEGQLNVDEARLRELMANYRQTIIAAFQDVENALTAVVRLQELEAANQDAVDSAQRAFDLANARFQFGTISILTVLDTERQLFQAEDSLLQVRLARLQAAVGLYRALGGGFDYRCELSAMTRTTCQDMPSSVNRQQ